MNITKIQELCDIVFIRFTRSSKYNSLLFNNSALDEEDLKQEAITYAITKLQDHKTGSIEDYVSGLMYLKMLSILTRDRHGLTGENYYPDFIYPDQTETEDSEIDMWDSLKGNILSTEEDNINLHNLLVEDVYVHSPTQTDAEILLHRAGMLGVELSGKEIARKYQLSESSVSRSLDLTTSILRKVPRLRQVNELYGA